MMTILDLHLKVDDDLADTYRAIPEESKSHIVDELEKTLNAVLHKLLAEQKRQDSWLDLLADIDQYAIDTGIADLSINHDHYLYGTPKQQVS